MTSVVLLTVPMQMWNLNQQLLFLFPLPFSCWCTLSKIQKPESLSALTALMQEPGSPEVKKPMVTEKDSKEHAQVVNYSIVIDVKSTVWR